MKCKVENCDSKVFSKGYCTAHYNRLRRHGSTEKFKAGRKPDIVKAGTLANFQELSKRTKQKFWAFLKTCDRFNIDAAEIIARNTKANGCISFNRLESIAKSISTAQAIDSKN